MRRTCIGLVLAGCLVWLTGTSFAAEEEKTGELFNGKDFTGWEGLTEKFWTIKDGAIVGSTFPKGNKFNTFLCSKSKYKDFELSFQVKLTGKGWAGNSGVQIRSKIDDPKTFAVAGPQADMGEGYWGCIYGERFHNKVLLPADKDKVNKILKKDEFNDYSVKCVGKQITVKINGLTTADGTIDDVPEEGIIAFQLHGGPPMEVTFKNIKLKSLGESK